MSHPTLLILAAGMGSRYGGIKQLDGFGPHGELIIDYTLYDAISVGFGKIVFVIRQSIAQDFEEKVLNKWKGKANIEVVYQELDALPTGYTVPIGRTKPWGTAHAVWMAESVIKEPFAIVNADDFYGRPALQTAHDYLANLNDHTLSACLVGYKLGTTLTDAGSVSRGVCETSPDGMLKSITERTAIYKTKDGAAYELEGQMHVISTESLVSMNLMGFTPQVFELIAEGFDEVYHRALEDIKVEYYIPSVLNAVIKKGINVPVLPTDSTWFGVTYTADKADVIHQLGGLHVKGEYPDNLWK